MFTEALTAKARSENVIPTICHGCSYGGYNCGLLAYVQDDELRRVTGNPHHPLNKGKLCAKGQAAVQWVYNNQRLKYPLRRIGKRGENRFKKISWDIALDTIARELSRIREEHGPEFIMLCKGQAASWGGIHQFLWLRFLHALGSPNFTFWGPYVCYGPELMYHRLTIGGLTFAQPDYMHADFIIEWFTGGGTGGAARRGTETYDQNLRSIPKQIIERLKEGAKLIVINPQLIPIAANGRASKWVPIRPGTDSALALSMINVIIKNDLYDHEFVARWCEGFEELRTHIQKYPPDWAHRVTGIQATEIRELATEYATTKRACIRVTEAPQKGDLQSFARAIPILMAITGHLDRPGGNFWYHPEIRLGFDLLKDRVSEEAREKFLGKENFYINWRGRTVTHFPAVLRALTTGKPYRPKAMMIFGANPLSTSRNPELIAKAISKLECLVIIDVISTPTSRFADIVLPAATRYECEGQPVIWQNHITTSNKVIEPLWETRNELQIVLDLACRLGLGDDFWNGDYQAMADDFLSPVEIRFQELKANSLEGIYRQDTGWMEERERYDEIFGSLPNGKVQLFGSLFSEQGLDPLPSYQGEAEDPLNAPELSKEYPLIFTDEHSGYLSHHAWMRDIPWLRELGLYPYVTMNPSTGKEYGIEDGDWVAIHSPHGTMKAVAVFFAGIRPDTLMGQHGWWQGCDALGMREFSTFSGGTNPNVLYDWTRSDNITGDMTKNTLVKIEKAPPPNAIDPVQEVE